jgi:hypothetical protein
MWRFYLLAEEICATEEGLQNVELDEYKENNLVVIRRKWSLKEDVMVFWYLSTDNIRVPGTVRSENILISYCAVGFCSRCV